MDACLRRFGRDVRIQTNQIHLKKGWFELIRQLTQGNMDEQDSTFKIVDRRLFNTDGSLRDNVPEEKAEPEVQATVSTAPEPQPEPEANITASSDLAEEADEEFSEEDISDANDPAGFINFAMSIASNAASALGMMEHPVTHKRDVDLELGKHWIDVLGMLQRKTNGNLSNAEAKILESLLSDLRMQYVSLNSSSAAKATGGFTGRDILGGS